MCFFSSSLLREAAELWASLCDQILYASRSGFLGCNIARIQVVPPVDLISFDSFYTEKS